MMPLRRPTRRDLLIVIGRLQNLIGRANAEYANDRDQSRSDRVQGTLTAAFDLALEARSHDPPIVDSGPWSERSSSR